MLRLIKWLCLFFFLFGVLLGVLITTSIEKMAIVTQIDPLNTRELKRVAMILQSNAPVNMRRENLIVRKIQFQDLNLLMSYFSLKVAKRIKSSFNSQVSLQPHHANLQMSMGLLGHLSGRYINIAAEFKNVDRGQGYLTTQLSKLRVGGMKIPGFMLGSVAKYAHLGLKKYSQEYLQVSQVVQSLKFESQYLTINFLAKKHRLDSTGDSLSAYLISDELTQALVAQANNLSLISEQLGKRPSLNEILKPMFRLAQKRSQETNPVIENRAVFIILGVFSLNRNITKLFDLKESIRIKSKIILLNKRFDLSKHFLVSAAITSISNSSLAESVGFYKELSDSQSRSGFSFYDLAADHAGIKLAQYSIENEQQARKIQSRLSMIKSEADYMPSIKQLPKRISGKEWNINYINSDAYKKTEKLIKQKINKLAIYH